MTLPPSMALPPCGCRTGCEHKINPQFRAQRSCRLGYFPRPPTGPAGASMPALDEGLAAFVDAVLELEPALRTLLDGIRAITAVYDAQNASTAAQSQIHLRKHGEHR
jgi:hypothetical protein